MKVVKDPLNFKCKYIYSIEIPLYLDLDEKSILTMMVLDFTATHYYEYCIIWPFEYILWYSGKASFGDPLIDCRFKPFGLFCLCVFICYACYFVFINGYLQVVTQLGITSGLLYMRR